MLIQIRLEKGEGEEDEEATGTFPKI